MRHVDRANVQEPDSLTQPSQTVAKEMADAIAFYATYDPQAPKAKGFDFQKYNGYDVTLALTDLFHNKCAYCESDIIDNLDVEHFRPKGRVTGVDSHSGYWWLAHSWNNLLPSCKACNQKRRQHIVTELMTVEALTNLMATKAKLSYGKANQFPVAGVRAFCGTDDLAAEEPELIDPTVDDPEPYFQWSQAGHYSVILPLQADPAGARRALTTINVFALNRVRLVQSRTTILTELRYQAQEIIDELSQDQAEGGASGKHLERALKRVEAMRRRHGPEQPYSMMVKAFVDDFAQRLQGMVKQ